MTDDAVVQDSRLAYAAAERLLISLPITPSRRATADRLAEAAEAVRHGDAAALMRAAITALAMAEQALEIRERLLAVEADDGVRHNCDPPSQ